MNYPEEYDEQFPPQTINSDTIIDFLDGKPITEEDICIISLIPNIYVGSIIKKNKKYYLFFQDNMCFPYDINLLKKIISYLQKTIKNITNDDLINLQKTRKENQKSKYPKKQPSPLKNKKQEGYIYILKAINQPHYKIGKTTNLNHRINQISPAMPFKTKLTHTIQSNDIDKTEKFLHKKFKDKRTNGEWFDLSQNDIDWLYNITNMNL